MTESASTPPEGTLLPDYSHPENPVRHSYPIAIKDAGFGTALGLLLKTLPYVLVRFGILLAFSVATIIYFSIVLGAGGWLVAKEGILTFMGVGFIGVGFGLYGYLWWFIIRYFLYLLKAGHIAVLTELILYGKLSVEGKGQFAYGKDIVKKNFGQVNILFGIDLLIQGIVRAFNRVLDFASSLLPVPGLQKVMGLVKAIITAATTFIDETLFSYSLARGDPNRWRSSRDGLIYYCQNPKEVLKTAVWVVILDYALTFAVWVLFLAPAFIITAMIPAGAVQNIGGLAAFVIAALFAANVKGAVLHPLFLIMVMIKFHVSVQGQEINESWDAKLSGMSKKFGKLKEGAANWKPSDNQAPETGLI
jgi:hypothetical protein